MNKADKIAGIVGITEAIKQYGMPSKYAPTIAIIIGALMGYMENPTGYGIFEGAIFGAAITGGYAVVKRAGTAAAATEEKVVISSTSDAQGTLEHDDFRGV